MLYLAPGASGGTASLQPHVAGLRRRGIEATIVELPHGVAERAVPRYRAAVSDPAAIIGGHSFGGRVASLLAAEDGCAGLVLLSYPLHRPGHPETTQARTAHWDRLRCPVLLLSGEADPFARLPVLRDLVGRLRDAELVTYPGIGHGLRPVLDDALDRITAFVRRIEPGT